MKSLPRRFKNGFREGTTAPKKNPPQVGRFSLPSLLFVAPVNRGRDAFLLGNGNGNNIIIYIYISA